MHRAAIILLIFFLFPVQLNAQVFPKEGSRLYYRIIGFSFPGIRRGATYQLQIAKGNYQSEDSFKRNIISSFNTDSTGIVAEVPAFGAQYTWRVVTKKSGKYTWSELYHFSTIMVPEVDTSRYRLRILKQAEKYKDDYVFSEASGTLYNMNGEPVWTMPRSKVIPPSDEAVYGDFKITDRGTITFGWMQKYDERTCEMDYDGNILWQGPKTAKVRKDSIENANWKGRRISDKVYMGSRYTTNKCHREFMRLHNGHYLILESEFMWVRLDSVRDPDLVKMYYKDADIEQDSDKVMYQRLEFGKLTEYDTNSNVVWSWSSLDYFLHSDVFRYPAHAGIFEVNEPHENGCYFDYRTKEIYISFKMISRVIKIQYPSGKILDVYGNINDPNTPGFVNDLFYHQHNCRLTSDGYLSVYNNNDRSTGSLPSLLLLKETKHNTLKKVWEYKCTVNGVVINGDVPVFGSGGSVTELPDRSLLACMSSPRYTKIFIVTRDKKILWSALPERWEPAENKWNSVVEYRSAVLMSKKEIERMIWVAELRESKR